jgi:hypothetical protein
MNTQSATIAPVVLNTAGDAPASISGPYSFEMIGNSMAPRIRSGETIYADPAVKPEIGDDCVFWNMQQRAIVGELLATTAETWRIGQWRGRGDEIDRAVLDLPHSEWPMCHCITERRHARRHA